MAFCIARTVQTQCTHSEHCVALHSALFAQLCTILHDLPSSQLVCSSVRWGWVSGFEREELLERWDKFWWCRPFFRTGPRWVPPWGECTLVEIGTLVIWKLGWKISLLRNYNLTIISCTIIQARLLTANISNFLKSWKTLGFGQAMIMQVLILFRHWPSPQVSPTSDLSK